MKNFKPAILETGKNFWKFLKIDRIESRLIAFYYDLSLNPVQEMFALFCVEKKKKLKTHPNTNFQPIFNGRNRKIKIFFANLLPNSFFLYEVMFLFQEQFILANIIFELTLSMSRLPPTVLVKRKPVNSGVSIIPNWPK